MATTANAFTVWFWKVFKITGVLLLLGINLQGINGNPPPIAVNVSTEELTTEEPIETSTIKDGAIELSLSRSEDVETLTSATPLFGYRLKSKDSDYRIAIHLWTCEYDEDEYIEIYTATGNHSYQWSCNNQTYNQEYVGSNDNATAIYFIDNINEDVWVEARFNFNSTRGTSPSRATIVVNIYQQHNNTLSHCDARFFDCLGAYDSCPHCCPSGDEPQELNLRCIPKELKCNQRPNCGSNYNIDEAYETCHLETTCPPCQSFCMSWNYIITSLAIAVLFIVTPTVIVFALFHRRNVALERARLERLAQARMADMRGEFTIDSPPTDLPPSYEEVYETKDPPPCFCQAVAMEGGGAEMFQSVESSEYSSSSSSRDVVIAAGMQNLGFLCSCSIVRDLPLDPIPSYTDVIENNNVFSISNNANMHEAAIHSRDDNEEIDKVEV